ncbi:hypothetical protein O3M35_001798 [Rhynocoris fuscipes]|uniref:SWIM-type domain-containing protein n=1 Tax=Rhynocoris fuscipes TaxID=488301 RepID=A0AAW1CPP3_9HEMI
MNDVPLQRRICPLEVRTLQRLVSTSRMYLVRQVGPTSWDVADSNRGNPNHVNNTDNTSTVRVSLGTSHRCSCLVFNRTKELCRHIVWILTHKLKLKCSDQLSYQLGMSEAQLLRCLEGKQNEIARRNKVDGNSKSVRGKPVPKRPISARDSCPICLESFGNKSVMYCKYSCGNAMHTHCMDIVSKHQDTSGSSSGPENGISCPLCRGFFCTPYELTQELRKPTILVKPQPLAKFEMTCIQCDASTIIGVVYKCAACPQVFSICSHHLTLSVACCIMVLS